MALSNWMSRRALSTGLLFMCALAPVSASARMVCTLVADAVTGGEIHREGDCATPRSPASTFKVVLAVIGFDTGFLKSPHEPVMKWKKGDADWGEGWREPTDPTSWLKNSVLWYSQRMAAALGAPRMEDYLRRFDYGNADMSGDPGKDNGLVRSWISSSLQISPEEQVRFVSGLATRRLPVSAQAMELTVKSMEELSAGGWRVKGKTGSYFPRQADGTFDRAHGWGWFVGFAEKDGRRIAFARLDQDEKRDRRPAGRRVRASLLEALPGLVK
jgi:Beta-lactamase class D